MKLAEIPVQRITASPFNPRHEAEGIDDLATSIATVGIIEPLVVTVDPKNREQLQLVCGNRRFAAAKRARLKVVPCIVLPGLDERHQRMVSLIENLHRRDMTHIEQGEAFRDLVATGLTQKQVAAQTGVSDFTVSVKVMLVTQLIPEMQELVHRDRMTVQEARSMCKLPKSTQREIFENGRKDQARPSKIRSIRRTHAEAALMRALDSYREGDFDMALAEAKRAVGFLSTKAVDAA